MVIFDYNSDIIFLLAISNEIIDGEYFVIS